MSKLVSVCIPTYNNSQYINETINCLIEQTYQNLEIIIIDDGSTDDTETLINAYKDPRIIYKKQINKGASSARNHAFYISTGSLIKFMDADDLISPNFIENQVARLQEDQNAIASSKWGRFYNDDLATFKLSPEPVWKDLSGIDWVINSLIDTGHNMMQSGIFLIPRSIINKAGIWNEGLSLIDDFEYFCRTLISCPKVLFCDEAVLMYRTHSRGLSQQKSRKHIESAYSSINESVRIILLSGNSQAGIQACSNVLQNFVYDVYPDHPDLIVEVEKQIAKLVKPSIKPEGGKLYKFLSLLFGWKKARLLKLFLSAKSTSK